MLMPAFILELKVQEIEHGGKNPKQRTIEERWAADNKLPNGGVNATSATEESLAWVAWFKDQDKKKKDKQ